LSTQKDFMNQIKSGYLPLLESKVKQNQLLTVLHLYIRLYLMLVYI